MLTAVTAFPILADAIRNERRHPDYKRVNELRELYYKVITGDGAKDILAQFTRREDAEAFRQRVAITQLTTIAWAGSIKQQYYRPGRLRNVKRSIGYQNNQPAAAAKLAEIESRVASYYGRESLEKWIGNRFVDLSFLDPNAFVVTEFKAFDAVTQKAVPYPVEYGSDEAILFRYVNNVLEYLLVKQAVTRAGVVLARYTMYLENETIVAEQLPPTPNSFNSFDRNAPSDTLPAAGLWDKDEKESYQISTFQPRAGQVPAFRVGFELDGVTKSRTCVSPLERAMPYFIKAIYETSTMDLSIALHAFPQKLFYAIACPGLPKRNCLSGYTTDSVSGQPAPCQRCSGSGVIVHKGAQDALAVPLPPVGAPSPAVPLKDMVAYVTPDIQILEFLDGHLRSLRQDAIDAVFNSTLNSPGAKGKGPAAGGQAPAAKTATEITAADDRADNTLAPFTDQCAALWRYTVGLIAELLDNGGPDLALVLEYPASCKIKTYDQLLAERKAAADAGAPHYVIQELDGQLAEMLFSSDASTLAKIRAKNYFTPFLGKSSEEIIFLFTSELARTEDKILWSYVDSIFDELGEEVPTFYALTRARQWELIKPKVAKIASELPQPVTALALPPAP